MVNTCSFHWFLQLCIISLFLLGGIALTPVATAETADTSGPVVQNYTISNDSFEAGETMKIDVNVTDETDIQRVYFRFENTEGGGAVFDAYEDFQPAVNNGTYTISYEWPEDTPAGTYNLSYISTSDSIGNRRTYCEEFPGEKQVTIDSNISDTTGPTITNYTIPSDSFEAGETMKINVSVTDETDIRRVYFRFENTEGGGAVFDAYQDFQPAVNNGTYTISYEWPEDTPAGTYTLSYISTSDSIGNRRTYFEKFPGKDRINITRANGSITATASETVGSEAPGFGHLTAITALISAALLVIWRRA